MSASETSRYVRLQVDLVLEVHDAEQLIGGALDRIAADEFMPDEERTHAESAVGEDEAEALAYLVDPFDLVAEVPGVELAQASWSSEQIDYDPDADDWELAHDEEDGDEESDEGAGEQEEDLARH
ncbi:hypothetical protein [Streptomyces sp. MUM 178J]|uniref:hypothetical protein n=1 Tax=Streptomyces sp. MUM 178J TaxID=2791991 RepID=UPI001F04AE0B|nr:hypothetical protein [Streptomyces sp. MUM 178J]WRQ81714.1 hypothetical protein I3F59_021435 [Streptomyces sp. MUM 178J]